MTRDLMREGRRPNQEDEKKRLTELHTTLANFTNEVQHVWDEYVQLLDLISEARPQLDRLSHNWDVRLMLDQHDFIIRTWDRDDDA